MATLWFVPPSDSDCDGWTASAEGSIGTDPSDACSNTLSEDAWPPDVNRDRQVNGLDAGALRIPFGSSLGDATYWARVDFNIDGLINGLDVGALRAFFSLGC